MTTGTFSNPAFRPPTVGLRTGRIALVFLVCLGLLLGGGYWLLRTYGKQVSTVAVDTTTPPSWIKQPVAYAATEPPPKVTVDPHAEALQKLLAAQHKMALELQAQREALEALKKRPPLQAPAPKPPTPPPVVKKPAGAMLFVSHDLKEAPEGVKAGEYTLAPASYLPCVLETAINSDVEGVFVCRVNTNVYDTAGGKHLLVPQGSRVLGDTQSSQLIYGNERLNTVSLKLVFPDGRHVDLGKAPVTDQQGMSGLTQRVDHHYGRLLAAVLIQGVLKAGTSALTIAANEAAGAGQVASGIAGVTNQAGNRITGPMINTRPTIEVDAGKICHIILLEPLHLPEMWQGGANLATTRRER